MSVTPEKLRQLPLLEGLERRELKRLAKQMHWRTFRAGETIVSEGTGGVGFSFVLDGTAEVVIRGERRGTLEAGDHFGELALLVPDHERKATVRAVSDVTCASITAWEFRPMVQEHPQMAWRLMCQLAERLARAEAYYAPAGDGQARNEPRTPSAGPATAPDSSSASISPSP